MVNLPLERHALVYFAGMAAKIERYHEVVLAMEKVAEMGEELTIEERNLLTLGYKNQVDSRRTSLRMLSPFEQKAAVESNTNLNRNLNRIREFRIRVENEQYNICTTFISLIDTHLLPLCTSIETFVFYHKTKGDFYRYLTEIETGEDRETVADDSLQSYQTALNRAKQDLPISNAVRLATILNHSVLHYEILSDPDSACRFVKEAIDETNPVIDTLSIDSHRLLQYLNDNLSQWSAASADENASNRRGRGSHEDTGVGL